MSLESDIRVVKIGLVDGIEASIAEMALSVFSSVVIATPVITGRLRGNWQPSFGEPATNALIQRDKSGQQTISKGTRLFALYEFGQKIFITNNVVYAQAVNDGDGGQQGWRRARNGYIGFGNRWRRFDDDDGLVNDRIRLRGLCCTA